MKTIKIVQYVFALVGLVFLISTGAIIMDTQKFIGKSVTTKGIVIDMEQRESTNSRGRQSIKYVPIVEYKTTSGKTFKFEDQLGSNPPMYKINQEVTVLYDPSTPQQAKINSFMSLWLLPLILGILGIVFFCIGISMLLWQKHRQDEITRLLQSGQKIQADIKEVTLNRNLKVNGRNPFRIMCESSESGQFRTFQSDNIWFDPTSQIKGQKIAIFIDPANPQKYYVDISFLESN